MGKTKEIIYFRESLWQSVLADTFMFGGILGLMYFNHEVLNGNGWIDAIFILFMLLMAAGRTSRSYKRFTSYQEMLNYLKESSK